jgi:hypothetical protein
MPQETALYRDDAERGAAAMDGMEKYARSAAACAQNICVFFPTVVPCDRYVFLGSRDRGGGRGR